MSQPSDNRDDLIFLCCALLILFCVVIPGLYAAHCGSINGPLLRLALAQVKIFAPFSEEARTAFARLSDVDPASLNWEQMRRILHYSASWIRWPLALILALCFLYVFFHDRVGRLVRRFNMNRLLKNNAASFPCLWPVVGRGSYLLSQKSFDSGLWRIARTPAQFALEHGLLLDADGQPFSPEQGLRDGLPDTELPVWGNSRLDEAKTLEVLRAQLGKPFGSYAELTPCRQALAVAFLTYAGGDKKNGVSILDAMSLSYVEKGEQATCSILQKKTFQHRLKELWERHNALLSERCLSRHAAFELPWFMALLYCARRKGVLANSQFLWLRPLDRPLWYALCQCGGRTAMMEGAAAWAHYHAEEQAGQALSEPHVAAVVPSLRAALNAQGWLTEIFIPPMSGAHDASLPEIVFSKAEDDPEYDANEDQTLAQEQY